MLWTQLIRWATLETSKEKTGIRIVSVSSSQHAQGKQKAVEWARRMLASNPIILDLETTGLRDAEIVQIGAIDVSGNVLMETFVRPTGRIPPDAIRIHGITDAMVANMPNFTSIYAQFSALLAGKTVIAYNVAYEKEVIRGECERRRLPMPKVGYWDCVMETYAQFWGDWNSQHRSFKWQSLANACRQQNILAEQAHRAVADCRAALALIRAMAQ